MPREAQAERDKECNNLKDVEHTGFAEGQEQALRLYGGESGRKREIERPEGGQHNANEASNDKDMVHTEWTIS